MVIDRVAGQCSLHIRAVTGDDEAEYLCEARNEHGTASTVQQLLVNCRYFLSVVAVDELKCSVRIVACLVSSVFAACDTPLHEGDNWCV